MSNCGRGAEAEGDAGGGWSHEQLDYALSEIPADPECSVPSCDCMEKIRVWRLMRWALGITTDAVGRA